MSKRPKQTQTMEKRSTYHEDVHDLVARPQNITMSRKPPLRYTRSIYYAAHQIHEAKSNEMF
jgi:hypothetical protein